MTTATTDVAVWQAAGRPIEAWRIGLKQDRRKKKFGAQTKTMLIPQRDLEQILSSAAKIGIRTRHGMPK